MRKKSKILFHKSFDETVIETKEIKRKKERKKLQPILLIIQKRSGFRSFYKHWERVIISLNKKKSELIIDSIIHLSINKLGNFIQ